MCLLSSSNATHPDIEEGPHLLVLETQAHINTGVSTNRKHGITQNDALVDDNMVSVIWEHLKTSLEKSA